MKCEVRSAKCGVSGLALLALIGFLLTFCGCATSRQIHPANSRPFSFQTDTFGYANELVWEYGFDANGKWKGHPRQPKPDYTHRCFVVARSARQFFQFARFDASLPKADEATYRKLIRRVVARDPQRNLPDSERIIIPGYANPREFSVGEEHLLKAECGGAWRSYFQRGHWRMIFCFSREHQRKTADSLIGKIRHNRPPVVHIVRFPQLTINHALVLFDVTETEKEIQFAVYDPNKPEKPSRLTFDRATKTFSFPANDYFPGGRVDIYEIYRSWLY